MLAIRLFPAYFAASKNDFFGKKKSFLCRKGEETHHWPVMANRRSFMSDMKAHHAEDNALRCDEIAERQVRALNEYRPPRDPKVRLADVKGIFEMMGEH
jgi:hypothetical protein